jgi:uncharacterized protein (DUF1501 family)
MERPNNNRKWKAAFWMVSVILLSLGAIFGAIWVTHTSTAQVANGQRRCAEASPHHYTVHIENGQAVPAVTRAKKCDILSITNDDPQVRLLAFGKHDDHISYDGVSERQLSQGQSLTVTLVKIGTYTFHDHIDDRAQGTFIVR